MCKGNAAALSCQQSFSVGEFDLKNCIKFTYLFGPVSFRCFFSKKNLTNQTFCRDSMCFIDPGVIPKFNLCPTPKYQGRQTYRPQIGGQIHVYALPYNDSKYHESMSHLDVPGS